MTMNNNIEPTSLGWGSEPGPKKKKTWIWIVVAGLVLCLCLVALGAGLYFFLNIRSEDVSTDQPGGSDYPPAPTMAPLATMFPTPTEMLTLPTTLVIEPFIPGSEYAFSLTEMVPLYEGSSEPGVLSWDVSISATQPVVVQQGWCAASTAILEENFEHIELTFEADGEMVDPDSLYMEDYNEEDMFCRSYLGIIRAWPLGEHVIIYYMTFDAPINDGWGDYPAGQYIDQFVITVTP
jgi:hypothetical protein